MGDNGDDDGIHLRVRGSIFGLETPLTIPLEKESGRACLASWARDRRYEEQLLVALRLYKEVKEQVLAEGSKDFRFFVFRAVFVERLVRDWLKKPEAFRRLRFLLRDPVKREAYFLREARRIAGDPSFFADRRQRWDPVKYFGETKAEV